jgi:uncharacterized protein YjdB
MANASYVSTGKPKVAGAVYRAPIGTSLPTDASSTLNGAFVELGYVSEDGVSNNNTPDSDKIKDWSGQTVLVVQNEKPDEWTLKLLESLNPNVLDTVYGTANVTYDGGAGTITVEANADQLEDQVYVIDMVLKGGALKRVVIPVGSLSEVGEIVYKKDEAIGYEITLEALPDASGNTHYEYMALASGSNVSISLDKSTASVVHGSTTTLVATTTPERGRVLWGTSDASKATVSKTGVVTGVATGSAVITAYFAGVTASCTVTVT